MMGILAGPPINAQSLRNAPNDRTSQAEQVRVLEQRLFPCERHPGYNWDSCFGIIPQRLVALELVFATGSARLTPAMVAQLQSLASGLAQRGTTLTRGEIVVESYGPLTAPMDPKLAHARAVAVARYLAREARLEPTVIEVLAHPGGTRELEAPQAHVTVWRRLPP